MFRKAFNTFKGGIHPSENKEITGTKEFSNLSIPQVSYIPLQQHIGKPAIPVVEIGDIVEEGQLIAKADGFISANVHSSVPGKVIEIAEYPTVYSKKGKCIVIEANGAFSSSGKTQEKILWDCLDREALLQSISDAGIVGMGGAAFPTSVKLSPPKDKKIDTLIINGAECEPYLTVDDMLMKTFAEDIIEGIRILLKVLNIDRAYIGIEKNKPYAAGNLRKSIEDKGLTDKITVVILKTKYPQGAEKQLIYSILKREVPSGGLPMEIGVVVQNVGTVFAVREAVVFGKPLFERFLTVTGKIVNRPGNYKVKIGTRISDIIEECGGLSEDPAKIIMGGPMCGITLFSDEVPVIKGTSGIIFLSDDEIPVEKYGPCIRCGRCVAACPTNLLPCDLGTAVETERYDIVELLNPFDCIMCSACSFVCPSRRPLSHFIKTAQEKLRKRKSA
ncbi:MAG: electron transport complex subunit RsxC [Spirochaetes bacterium]|nr:electron transport complex subunit RsxC [Spirochaetota bacterium]